MSSSDLANHVKAAITALSNPGETMKANEWLVDFEKSTAAWEIAKSFVDEGSESSYRFFGAKFLYSKTQKQFVQLDSNTVEALTQSLVQNIIRISQEPNVPLNVCRYLCLALATVALQMNRSGIIQQILVWLNPIISSAPSVLLELLIVLPEESCNRLVEVSPGTRQLFIEQLSQSAGDVLAFLSTLWPTVRVEVKSKILKCTEKWVAITRIQAPLLLASPMLQNIVQVLRGGNDADNNDMFDDAVDAAIAILHRFGCKERTILELIIPVVLELRGKWAHSVHALTHSIDSIDPDDEINLCRSLSRLFTETAESSIDLFISYAVNIGQMEILPQLLECARFRFDPDIARIPLRFFYELSMLVKFSRAEQQQRENESGKSTQDTYDIVALNRMYTPMFLSLIDIGIEQMSLPFECLSGAQAISDEKFDQRLEWREATLDCCYVVGGTAALTHLCSRLQSLIETLSNNNGSSTSTDIATIQQNWGYLESTLVCVQVVAPFVDRDDNSLTPQLINFCISPLPAAQLNNGANPQPLVKLKIAVIEVLGRFSSWLEAHSGQFLEPVFGLLQRELNDKDICQNAACSLMALLRQCSRLQGMGPAALQLNTILLQLRSNNSNNGNNNASFMSLESELFLLNGIISVVSHLPDSDADNAFKLIMHPLAQDFQNSVHQQQQSRLQGSQPSASILFPNIERMTTLFRNFYHDGQCPADVLSSIMPIFNTALEVHPTSDQLAEKTCRLYKHAIRCCRRDLFLPHIPAMTQHLSERFAKLPVAAFLYAGSVCVGECSNYVAYYMSQENGDNNSAGQQNGNDNSNNNGQNSPTPNALAAEAHIQTTLYQMLWSMSTTFFTTYKSLTDFEQNPDVVEEYFFLIAKALQDFPAPFVESTAEASTVVQAAISGLALRHREAQKGILLFFERLINLLGRWPEHSLLHGRCYEIIGSYCGAPLVNAVFSLLSGNTPAYSIDENNGSITDVLWGLQRRCGTTAMKGWISQSLGSLPSEAQEIAHKMQLLETLTNTTQDGHKIAHRDFGRILDTFALHCRRCV